MYSFKSRVRYSECNEKSDMTVSALVNYFQDCCTFHSESLNLGRQYWEDNQVAWILSYWHIVIERFPKLGEEICISTWPYEIKGFMAHRNFLIKDENQQVIAYANSVWAYMDTAKGRLKRVDEAQKRMYEEEPPYPMVEKSRKVEVKGELEAKETFKVQRFYIDSNQHVNNEKYILMAMEYLPEDFIIKSVRVEYKQSAVLGDVVYPKVGMEGHQITVLLGNEASKPFAIVEFSGAMGVQS
jgi:acyl-ACP thioesterase